MLSNSELLPVDWEPITAIIGKQISKLESDLRMIYWSSEMSGMSLSICTFFTINIYNVT
jgi:hypothetical protein